MSRLTTVYESGQGHFPFLCRLFQSASILPSPEGRLQLIVVAKTGGCRGNDVERKKEGGNVEGD